MFAIAVPSTITLTTPAEDGGDPIPFATIRFSHPTDDVSKCQLTLTEADGHEHIALFGTQGGVLEQSYTSADEIEKQRKAEWDAAEPERERERQAAEAQKAKELSTADDTTEDDVAWEAQKTAKTYPAHRPTVDGDV